MQSIPKALGKAIRLRRKKKGLSQDALSGLAGIARTHLTMIENGNIQPTLETLWKIASALDTKPSKLFQLAEAELDRMELIPEYIKNGV